MSADNGLTSKNTISTPRRPDSEPRKYSQRICFSRKGNVGRCGGSPQQSHSNDHRRQRPDTGKLAEYQKAQGAVTSALGKLLAITENYPDLKANQNFLELQAQLEGTENRINVARTNFNNAAKNFNTAIRRFPKNILAGIFGFEKRAYFEAAEGSEQAPKVEF